MSATARVVKLVDTADLKSAASRKRAYGFDPRPGHYLNDLVFYFNRSDSQFEIWNVAEVSGI